jgi:membrane associated rhomboid family serine protease
MKITFNAPFTLAYACFAIAVYFANQSLGSALNYHFFSVRAPIGIEDPFSILRLFLHTFGHANWTHLTSNMAIILLVGPLVEDYYGLWRLALMALVTSVVTGGLHSLLFPSSLMGASGIAFMMILLGPLTNSKRGSIPLTFLLVAAIYLGNEFTRIFQDDNISQLSHIAGGFCGMVFGFILKRSTD